MSSDAYLRCAEDLSTLVNSAATDDAGHTAESKKRLRLPKNFGLSSRVVRKKTVPVRPGRRKPRQLVTDATKNDVLRLLAVGSSYATGYTHQEIAQMTGCTINIVKNVADQNKMTRGPAWKSFMNDALLVRQLKAEGLSDSHIIQKTGFIPAFLDRIDAIKENRGRGNPIWTKKVAEVQRRFRMGEDLLNIAEAMNCSYTAVKSHITTRAVRTRRKRTTLA